MKKMLWAGGVLLLFSGVLHAQTVSTNEGASAYTPSYPVSANRPATPTRPLSAPTRGQDRAMSITNGGASVYTPSYPVSANRSVTPTRLTHTLAGGMNQNTSVTNGGPNVYPIFYPGSGNRLATPARLVQPVQSITVHPPL